MIGVVSNVRLFFNSSVSQIANSTSDIEKSVLLKQRDKVEALLQNLRKLAQSIPIEHQLIQNLLKRVDAATDQLISFIVAP
jgi:hypothetical protein